MSGLVRLARGRISAGECRFRLASYARINFGWRPFVLLGGTVVALILLVAGSIALLSGIGSQELPSTLTGTVSVGHKRD